MKQDKIDFVVMWVDGNDPVWREEKNKYKPHSSDNSASDNRFRDWDLFRYWFRGVAKYAPWVNHIYLITCGHYPEWLNLNNPKLSLIKHEDYIPKELLPTFNANTIEMNLHRIPELAEQFVLFNDDMFLISDTTKEDFFVEGKPCESGVLGIISSQNYDDVFPHILLNDISIINKYFNKGEVLRQNKKKFFSLKYGIDICRNIALLPFVYFSTFMDFHLASSHLKSNFIEVWDEEPDAMLNATKSRFRSVNDVNQYMIKAWNMCKGQFVPRSPKWGKKFELGLDGKEYDYIVNQKGKVICLNDSKEDIPFDDIKQRLKEAFEAILPEVSEFEI